MSRRRIFFLVSALVIGAGLVSGAVWWTAVGTTSAQEVEKRIVEVSPQGPVARAQEVDAAEVEVFRARLVDYYGDLLELEPYVAEFAAPGLRGRIVKAQEMAAELAPEHLVELEEVFSEFPMVLDHPSQLLSERGFLQDIQEVGQRYAQAQGGVPVGLEYGSSGPVSPCVTLDTNIVYGLKVPLKVADILLLMVPDDLNITIAGFGGTVWTHPATLVAGVLYEIYDAMVFAVEWVADVGESCEQGFHRDLVNNAVDSYLDASVAGLYDHVTNVCGSSAPIEVEPGGEGTATKVELGVTQLTGKGRFLVLATDAGQPLDGAEFVSVEVAAENGSPPSFADAKGHATVTDMGQGMYFVEMQPPTWDTRYANVVLAFQVQHGDHYGATLFQGRGLSVE